MLYSAPLSRILPHVLVVTVLLSIAILGCIEFQARIIDKFDSMEKISGPVQPTNEDEIIISKVNKDIIENNRILGQLQIAKDEMLKYYLLMKFFYSQYYMSISVMLIFGLISAIALIFITKKGWDQANRYVIQVCTLFDKQLVKTHNIAIGFDETKLPNYREVFTEK